MNDLMLVRAELYELVARWAWLLDSGQFLEIPSLFTDDGVYIVDEGIDLKGRAALEERYAQRRSTDRLTRHVCTNLRVELVGADHAKGWGLLTVFRTTNPKEAPAIPCAVQDFADEYVRGSDGCWRFQRRVVTGVFGERATRVAPSAKV